MLVFECGDVVMAKRPTTESIAEGLTAAERVLLLCIGSDSDLAESRGKACDHPTDDGTRFDRTPRGELRADCSRPCGPGSADDEGGCTQRSSVTT
jgi:hypothetical protein